MSQPYWLVRCAECGHSGKISARRVRGRVPEGQNAEAWIAETSRCNQCGNQGGHHVRLIDSRAVRLVGAGLNTISDPIYHLATCRWVEAMNVDELIEFPDEVQAQFRGFRPCKVCKPDSARKASTT